MVFFQFFSKYYLRAILIQITRILVITCTFSRKSSCIKQSFQVNITKLFYLISKKLIFNPIQQNIELKLQQVLQGQNDHLRTQDKFKQINNSFSLIPDRFFFGWSQVLTFDLIIFVTKNIIICTASLVSKPPIMKNGEPQVVL